MATTTLVYVLDVGDGRQDVTRTPPVAIAAGDWETGSVAVSAVVGSIDTAVGRLEVSTDLQAWTLIDAALAMATTITGAGVLQRVTLKDIGWLRVNYGSGTLTGVAGVRARVSLSLRKVLETSAAGGRGGGGPQTPDVGNLRVTDAAGWAAAVSPP